MDLRLYKDASITPTRIDGKHSSGAVYDSCGDLIADSQRNANTIIFANNNPEKDTDTCDIKIPDPCIYMGHLTTHYGHFLLESLSRFYALLDFKNKYPFKYFVFNRWILPDVEKVSSYLDCPLILSILKLFNIDKNSILVIEKKTRFCELYLPIPSFVFYQFPPQFDILNQGQVYSRIIEYVIGSERYTTSGNVQGITKKGGGKYYIKRSLKDDRISNHLELEKIFEEYGFALLDTCALNFYEQVTIYNNATVIASIEGTGTHNSVFMKKGRFLINIGSSRFPGEVVPPTQLILNKINDTQLLHIPYIGNNDTIDISFFRDKLSMHLDYIKNSIGL